jgi:hypothetical protein
MRQETEKWERQRQQQQQEFEEKLKKQQEEFAVKQKEMALAQQKLEEAHAKKVKEQREQVQVAMAKLKFEQEGPFPDTRQELKDDLLLATKAIGNGFQVVDTNVSRLAAQPQPPSGVLAVGFAAVRGAVSSSAAVQNATAAERAQELAQWQTMDFTLCEVLEKQFNLLGHFNMMDGAPLDYDDQKSKAGKRRRVYEAAEQHTQEGGGCNCKKNKSGAHCQSRCPCTKAGRACGFFCRCKHCECLNPNGTANAMGVHYRQGDDDDEDN